MGIVFPLFPTPITRINIRALTQITVIYKLIFLLSKSPTFFQKFERINVLFLPFVYVHICFTSFSFLLLKIYNALHILKCIPIRMHIHACMGFSDFVFSYPVCMYVCMHRDSCLHAYFFLSWKPLIVFRNLNAYIDR